MTLPLKHRFILFASSLAMLSTASGCDLIYEDLPLCPEEQLQLVFNWSEVGDPTFIPPEGMTTLYYPTDGSDYWRYETDPDSAKIDLPYNAYNILAMNNDTRSINHFDIESYNGALVFTLGSTIIETVFRVKDGAEPPHPDVSQPLRQQADMMYVADHGDTIHDIHDNNLRVTLYPRQFTPNYKVIVDSIGNLGSISVASFALSGLAGAKYLVTGERIETPVTLPGNLAVSGPQQLSGNVVSFGPSPGSYKNFLCIYVWLRNGEKFVYMFDVTDQIASSPDQMNLTIRVGGFSLPDIPSGGGNIGNINIGIDNWINVDIDLNN